jgi:hypothetical protein
LNTDADSNTAKEGATKKRKRPTHHKQQQQGTVSKTQHKRTKYV